MYYKAATDEKIAEYRRDYPDDYAGLDGTTAEKAKMLTMDEFHSEIAFDLLEANIDANSDVANGAYCNYVVGEYNRC